VTQVLITKAYLLTPKQAICQTGFHLDKKVFPTAARTFKIVSSNLYVPTELVAFSMPQKQTMTLKVTVLKYRIVLVY